MLVQKFCFVYSIFNSRFKDKTNAQKTFSVSAKSLKSTVRFILESASAKRLVIRHGQKVLIDLPIGVVGVAALLAPLLAGISAAFVLFDSMKLMCITSNE